MDKDKSNTNQKVHNSEKKHSGRKKNVINSPWASPICYQIDLDFPIKNYNKKPETNVNCLWISAIIGSDLFVDLFVYISESHGKYRFDINIFFSKKTFSTNKTIEGVLF